MSDPINPCHYKRAGLECVNVVEAMVEGWPPDTAWRLGQVVEYLWRHREKGGTQDLHKAVWYLKREITKRHERGET